MTVDKPHYAPGHVETLTPDQERKLKLVWSYMLTFFGYKLVHPDANALTRTTTTNSVLSEEDTKKKKKKRLLGKLKLSHRRSQSIEKLERVLTHRSSISVKSKDFGASVHPCFKGLDPKDMYKAFWMFLRQDTPDNLVLRFVRARKWNVDKSLGMMSSTMKWRYYEGKPDEILFDGELGCKEKAKKGAIYQFKLGKCIIRGHDKVGRPIAMVRARLHHASDQTQEEVAIYTLLTIEYARLLLDEPIDSCDIIFNLSNMTMANMDWSAVSYMVRCFESHYPESLGILFVHKAPWIFSGIWRIVRKWLDPVVASKIVFTNNVDDLAKKIDRDQIAKELGGDDDYEWKYLQPTKSKNGLLHDNKEEKERLQEVRKQLISEFIQKTIEWIEATDDISSAKLLGERIDIGHRLAENYRVLDGYIRNRSYYDRVGTINVLPEEEEEEEESDSESEYTDAKEY